MVCVIITAYWVGLISHTKKKRDDADDTKAEED